MNKLTNAKRTQVVAALVEGMSIRATVRMTGVAKNTIVKLLADLGSVCSEYQNKALRDLPCKRIQADEIWSFIYAKAKNVPDAKAAPRDAGDVWTWTAIDADTKLVPSWRVGPRDLGTATEFMRDLAGRLSSKVQFTTDGLKAYLWAVEDAFGGDIDFAQLQKVYGQDVDGQHRYSPPVVIGTKVDHIAGSPDPEHVSTS